MVFIYEAMYQAKERYKRLLILSKKRIQSNCLHIYLSS